MGRQLKRRRFLQQLGLASALTALCRSTWAKAAYQARQLTQRYLRPPGALAEAEFVSRCIRCNQCAEACPNDCIKFFDLSNGLESQGTPYIIPREKACILCMKCGDACPTGALQPIQRALKPIVDNVDMGQARVDETLCLSYQGKSCGVCYRACPLQDVAITVGYMEQPHVTADCVGCGLCERSCIQIPQAIKILPRHTLQQMGGVSG